MKSATTGQIVGRAHKLCEWLRSENVSEMNMSAAPLLAVVVELSSKWYVGDVAELPDINDRETLDQIPLRMPSSLMLIEAETEMSMADGRVEQTTLFLVCRNTVSDVIEITALCVVAGRYVWLGEATISVVDGMRRFGCTDTRNGGVWANIVELTLLALSCNNVRSVDVDPPESLNKKRLRSGKSALFTYKTLHVISGDRRESEGNRDGDADDRKSPRLHFRRGHIRHLGDGRITWVQQCMVGDRRLGMVDKAYSLHKKHSV